MTAAVMATGLPSTDSTAPILRADDTGGDFVPARYCDWLVEMAAVLVELA